MSYSLTYSIESTFHICIKTFLIRLSLQYAFVSACSNLAKLISFSNFSFAFKVPGSTGNQFNSLVSLRCTGSLPDNPVLKELESDTNIELVSDKGLGKECWRCNACTGKNGPIVGDSWSGALKHLVSKGHVAKTVPQGMILYPFLCILYLILLLLAFLL